MGARVVPGLIVNDGLEILEYLGATGPYVRFRPGRASLSLRAVLRTELHMPVLGAIEGARNSRRAEAQGCVYEDDARPRRIKILVRQETAAEGRTVYRVLFEESEGAAKSVPFNEPKAAPQPPNEPEIGRLKQELEEIRESFASALIEQEKRSRDTHRTDSDLQAELESINAEVEAANEELHAALVESQESERRLRESEERFERFMQHLPGLAWIKELDGRYIYVNQAAEQVFRTSRAELYGKTDAEIFPEETAQQFQRNDRQALSTAAGIQTVETLEHADGVHHSIVSKFPIRAADGSVTLIGGVAIDITDQRKAESAIRESEERFRMLADSSPALIWVNGLEGCEFVNRAYLEFLGVTTEDVQKFGWAHFIHPDERDHAVSSYLDAFSRRENYVLQHRFRRADGQYRWMKSVGMPRLSGGEFQGYVGSTLDITDIKEAEDALREADRRKDEFLAMLGHELRNPLAAISTGMTLLQSGPAPARRAWIEEMVGRQVSQLRRLVDDLLDVARITRGKIVLRKERIALGKVLQGSVTSVEELMARRSLEFSFPTPQTEIYLDADPARLEQMVVNLLTNAAKYTPQGGKVWLTIEREGEDAVIRCRDTGVGLTPEIHNAIFEPFAQYNLSGDGRGEGLGMGLALVRALAEMHGGAVSVSSEGPGKGSEFVIHLPAPTSDSAPTSCDGSAASSRARPLRILVVDDNRDLAESLALFFRGAGHEVSVAHDGETAVPMALREQPEIVILDIGLPGMDGFGVAEQLRASADMRDTMIVAMSGWDLREKVRQGGVRFDAQLVKPVEHNRLIELLQRKGALIEGA